MHAFRLTAATVAAGLALAAGCQTARTSTATTGTTTTTATVGTSTPVAERPTAAPPTTGAPGGAPDTTRPRRRPDPRALDSLRRGMVARLLTEIAGRENEPAERVFKNVQVLKDIPARELLRTMDEQYGRALTWSCSNCHVPGQWDSDEKKNKKIAREMQRLTERLNTKDLPAVPELDTDFDKVSCVTCHRGSTHPANTMAVPAAPAPGGTPNGPPGSSRPPGDAR